MGEYVLCRFRKVQIVTKSYAEYFYKEGQDPEPLGIGEKPHYLDLVEHNHILDGYKCYLIETIDNSIDFSAYDSPGSILEYGATVHTSGDISLKVDCPIAST